MSTVILDTETTGLLQAEGNLIENQPHIIELFALKIDDDFEIEDKFHTLIKPPIPLPKEITKITSITDADLKGAPVFSEIYRPLVHIFFGAHTFVAHNLPFDLGMLVYELRRIDKEHKFPYPPIHYCTAAQSIGLRGYRLKLQELYEIATGAPEIKGAHRAEADVLALYECYKWMRTGGKDVG